MWQCNPWAVGDWVTQSTVLDLALPGVCRCNWMRSSTCSPVFDHFSNPVSGPGMILFTKVTVENRKSKNEKPTLVSFLHCTVILENRSLAAVVLVMLGDNLRQRCIHLDVL